MNNNPSNSIILSPDETKALRIAVGFMTAGEADGVPRRFIEAAQSAFDKLNEAPEKSVWIPFSQAEISLIRLVFMHGAEEVLQAFVSRSDVRDVFWRAANRITDADIAGSKVLYADKHAKPKKDSK